MDIHCGKMTSSEGLQDWFTDPDGWLCRFEARLTMSRLQPNSNGDAVYFETNPKSSTESKLTQNRHANIQPSLDTVTLQEMLANGLVVKQKGKFRNKNDILNIFKGNEDLAYYDHVLMMMLKGSGRKHVYKYIRSKI